MLKHVSEQKLSWPVIQHVLDGQAGVFSIAFSPDGKCIVSGSNDYSI